MARKADAHIQKEPEHGKQKDQKMKPYLVLQYLMRFTDANNIANAFDILAFLDDCGITADPSFLLGQIQASFFHVLNPLPFKQWV